MSTRDRDLPLAQARQHENPQVLEESVRLYMGLLRNANVATSYMAKGSYEDLSEYAYRNTAVTGYVIATIFNELENLPETTSYAQPGLYYPSGLHIFPKDCVAVVSFQIGNIKRTQKTIRDSTVRVEEDMSTGAVKKQFYERQGHGVTFDLRLKIEFRSPNASTPNVVGMEFAQTVVIEPDASRRSPYSEEALTPPAPQQFEIGAVCNLFGVTRQTTHTELSQMVALPTGSDYFPRRNASVADIELSLANLGAMTDMIVKYLAQWPPFRAAATRTWAISMPWGPARHEVMPAEGGGDVAMDGGNGGNRYALPYIGDVRGAALDQFHQTQLNGLVGRMGVMGNVLQRLSLLKNYATHLKACYASIDHFMLRAFMAGIGDHNADLFVKHEPLDPLLHKIAVYRAGNAGLQMQNSEIDIVGCSVEVKVKLPGNAFYEPLMGMPYVDTGFAGKLSFGTGSKPIPVAGYYTRQLFVLPTESNGGAGTRPQLKVVAESEYSNPPVVVVIGTADGATTNVKTVFLLADAQCMQLAIQIGAIPSKKVFAQAMTMLPPEMQEFATAIRACDLAESGLDLHVIHLQPVLASALGVDYNDLNGDPEWMTQLLSLMRGGVSLQSIAQVNPHAEEDYDTAERPTYDLGLMKQETAKLLEKMHKQGKIDHGPLQPPPQPVPPPAPREYAPAYRSLGASSMDYEEAPRYNSMSAGVYTPAPAPAPAPARQRAVGPAPGASGATSERGGGSVKELEEGMQRLGTEDRNFMTAVMDRAAELGHAESVFGAKIMIPDCATNCEFARGKVPDGVNTADFEAATDGDYGLLGNLDASAKVLRRMLGSHAALGKSVQTTRLVVFGALVEWETNLLTGLMSGRIDPTKKIRDTMTELNELQRGQ